MKRIAFYSHRVFFIENWIKPLSLFLDCEVFVLHIQSIERLNLPEYPNLKLIDVSWFSAKQIQNTIKSIRPNILISLGFKSIMELLIVRICKQLNIKVIYLEHGLFTKDTTKHNFKNTKSNFLLVLKQQSNLILKYLQFLLLTQNKIKEARILVQVFILNKYYVSKFDKALFFAEYGHKRLDVFFQYDSKQVIYCGYPLFKSESEEKSLKIELNSNENKSVLYIHQTFILNKQSSIDYKQELEYLLSIWVMLKKKYSCFTLLLHPREDLDKYLELYKNTGIQVIQKPNDYKIFINKDLIIGHYSTALLYPLFFNLKTVIVNYPKIKIDTIFKDFCEYCENLNELEKYCILSKTTTAITKPLNYLIGDKHSYENISSIIKGLIQA